LHRITLARYARDEERPGRTLPTVPPLATHLLAEVDGISVRADPWEQPAALWEGVVYVRNPDTGEPLRELMANVKRPNGSSYYGVDSRALANMVGKIAKGADVGPA